ncbi:MAG: FeoB-associated Cys-rich membrane protein [Bacteroidaceae bacterium]|nr:FeoB-associated Cys-rich membrane protein [Bacteroidaceae bacterium]
MFQDILVYAIVAATVCYAAYHFWKAASGKGKCNCSSCGKKCNCHKD